MNIQDTNNQLTASLKALIIKRKHNDTGKLLNTLRVKLIDDGVKLTLNINAQDYLKFVDEGKLLNEYIKAPSTKKIIGAYVKAKLINEFKGSTLS